MRKIFSVMMLSMLILTSMLMAAPAAQAEEATCRGTIGARTVDNLRVPQGKSCTLNGTRVKGTIKVERDATLKASQVTVIGNVQAENHKFVSLAGSRVGGSVQFDQGARSTSPPPRSRAASRSKPTAASRTYARTRSTPTFRSLAIAMASISPTTGSMATCSARRISQPQPAVATLSRGTKRISASGSKDAAREDQPASLSKPNRARR